MKSAVVVFLMLMMVPLQVHAFSPIAHTDVVPYQRIKHGSSFDFGVVAFSKPGIEQVRFAISGQGYSGDVKTATAMELNTRVASAEYPGVWEYFVTLRAAEFTGNGPITVTPTVTDKAGNTRALDPVTLIVEGESTNFDRIEAWVDLSQPAGSGSVGQPNNPFPSIQAAISAAQAANGGSSSGNTIYLAEGTYSIAGLTADTREEWLTITKAASANRDRVIINEGSKAGRINIDRLKVDHVTLQSQGSGREVLHESSIAKPYRVWTNSCRFLGCGREIEGSNPVVFHHRLVSDTDQYYSTDDYTYNVRDAYGSNNMVRGAIVSTVRNDVFHAYTFVVNAKVDNVSNGGSGVHADVLQVFQNYGTTLPVNNTLAYNVYATDIRYQGIMRTSAHQTARDNAYINVFIEMREKGDNDEKGRPQIKSVLNSAADDHLLIWHCSFPYAQSTIGKKQTNSSIVGNLFWQLRNSSPGDSTDYLHNHYMHVDGSDEPCNPSSWDEARDVGCPAPSSIALDTGADTHSVGGGQIDISDPGAANFGYPVAGSRISNRLPSVYVACDALGNPRDDGQPDIGAIEASKPDNIPSPPTDFRVDQD